MRFVEVLKKKMENNPGTRTPIIAFLGDSVTQGVFEVYEKDGKTQVVFDSKETYSEKVKKILGILYPQAPVSVVNAGVNGSSAPAGYERLKRDVLGIEPDLLVVCFGLNDSNGEMEGIENYRNALRNIFRTAKEADVETIFMTPNMLNTHAGKVAPGELLKSLAEMFAKRQNEGIFDAYMDAAREVCLEENVTLCDCYAIWKKMHECGVDTTGLLSNGLNHPVREMHNLFAWQLVYTILSEERG